MKEHQFGKYTLVEKIGTGGMAEVYKAVQKVHLDLERIVAIKGILSYYSEDKTFIQMFLDEAKIGLQLSHPNIAQVYEIGEHQGQYFIAMEYVDGPNLSTLLKRLKTLGLLPPPAYALFITEKIASALFAAHSSTDNKGSVQNVIHRDVSPHNILISSKGHIKLIDFGVAKAKNSIVMTEVGTVRGKLFYLSPEQSVRGSLNFKTDIFSLGLVLFEMLTGYHPFRGQTKIDVLTSLRSWRPLRLHDYRPDLPPVLGTIITRMLAPHPEDRHSSCEELRTDLARLLYSVNPDFSQLTMGEFVQKVMQGEISPNQNVQDPQSGSQSLSAENLSSNPSLIPKPGGSQSYSAELSNSTQFPSKNSPITGTQPSNPSLKSQSTDKTSRVFSGTTFIILLTVIASLGLLIYFLSSEISFTTLWNKADPAPFSKTEAVEPETKNVLSSDLTDTDISAPEIIPIQTSNLLTSVEITSTPSNATVTIKGNPETYRTPLKISYLVPEQHYYFTVSAEGYETLELELTPKENEPIVKAIELFELQSELYLSISPQGALIFINETQVGTSESEEPFVLAGLNMNSEVVIKITKSGYKTVTQTIVLSKGEVKEEITLEKIEKKSKYGYLVIHSIPSGQIFIDGKNTGKQTGSRKIKIRPGKHRVLIINKKTGKQKEEVLNIKENQKIIRRYRLE